MSFQNMGFYEDLRKIIFELSSNTHLISAAVYKPNPHSLIGIFVVCFYLVFDSLLPASSGFNTTCRETMKTNHNIQSCFGGFFLDKT